MGNVLNRETMGFQTKRVHNWCSWILTAIFFVVVIIYAGIRGHLAYHQTPAEIVVFQSRTSVPFPVISYCPLVPVPMTVVECELELNDSPVGACDPSTIVSSSLIVEGVLHQCISFNALGTISSDPTVDELAILVSINSSLLPATDPVLGAFVIVHEVGELPLLEIGNSFVADGGKLTEAFLRMDETHDLDGSVTSEYTVSASSASSRDPTMADTMDVDFWFANPGAYVHTQYLNYTVDMWIGEVGGFTCLLTFLHTAVLWIFMLIYRRIKPEQPQMRLNDEREKN